MNNRKIKYFLNLNFFKFMVLKNELNFSDKIQQDLLIKGLGKINDLCGEKYDLDRLLDNNRSTDFLKFGFLMSAHIAYPSDYIEKKLVELLEETPEIQSFFDLPLCDINELSSSLIGDIYREIFEDSLHGEWLFLDIRTFISFTYKASTVIDKIHAVASLCCLNNDQNSNSFYKKLINYTTYTNTSKGGLTASQNRKQKEYGLKKQAIEIFSNNNPRTNRRWRSRNEFYDYFITTVNKNISNENEWVKTSTVKRWITEYLANRSNDCDTSTMTNTLAV